MGTRVVVWRPAQRINVSNLASWSSRRGRNGLKDEQQNKADIVLNCRNFLRAAQGNYVLGRLQSRYEQ